MKTGARSSTPLLPPLGVLPLISSRSAQSTENLTDTFLYEVRRYLTIKSASAPKFAPDGMSVAFLSDLTGIPQVWSVGLSGEEKYSLQLLSFEDERRVGSLCYARSRDLIAYTVDEGGNERFQIRLLENKGERLYGLTDQPSVIHKFGGFSRGEDIITFSSNRRNQAFFDVYVQKIDSREATLVYASDETNFALEFDPKSDSRILFLKFHSPFNHDLFLLDTSDDSNANCITPHSDEAVFEFSTFDVSGRGVLSITDAGREFRGLARIYPNERSIEYVFQDPLHDVDEFKQSPDGRKIALTLNREGYSELLIISPDEDFESLERIEVPHGVISGLDWSYDSKKLVFGLSSSTLNSDIWMHDFVDGKTKRLTWSSTSGIRRNSFSEPSLVKFRSFDGLEICSYLFFPTTQSDGAGRFPLIVWMHGGPESQFRPSFSPVIQYLVKLGFAVGAPNFRGSTGYGRKFMHLDDVRRRMDTVKDIAEFVMSLSKDPALSKKIDFSKIAAWGGSYGGFMVLACLYEYPDLWAAGVDIVGIANFVTFLKNTGPWRRKHRMVEYGDLEKDSDFLSSISPVNNAERIRAPLFVIHGTNDPRVPFEEAEQIVNKLRSLGRTVHLMKFEDEGHGLVKTKNKILGYSSAIKFLVESLKEDKQLPG